MKKNKFYYVIFTLLLLADACRSNERAADRRDAVNYFVLKSVVSSCLNRNFYYKDADRNIEEILKVRNYYYDRENDLIIEKHRWSAGSCDVNVFLIVIKNDKMFFVPYCDESNIKKYSILDNKCFCGSQLNDLYVNSIKFLQIKNQDKYAETFVKALFNSKITLTENGKYHFNMLYGRKNSCVWEVSNRSGVLSFCILNPLLYECLSL